MVGYYNEDVGGVRKESLQYPVGGVLEGASDPVKSLVCSPDLVAVFAAPERLGVVGSHGNAVVGGNTPLEDEKSYQCLICQKTFDQKSVYQSHVRSHGKDGEDPYRCNICSKTFAVPARLTRHYRTHTGEKPYQCEYCNKSFSVKENLSVHRRIHTKERPYKCDVCDRAFEHSGKLHRHMRIHTGERPHKCSVCAKTFIQSGQLVIHMRTHTGEKPYVCKSCGKGFTCSKQLKVHTRTHTGEKPYTCEICGKSFGYNHVLKLHQVAHYGEKVYKCTLCHETFNSKKTMESHIKTHSESPRDSPIEPVIEISPHLTNRHHNLHHHHHHLTHLQQQQQQDIQHRNVQQSHHGVHQLQNSIVSEQGSPHHSSSNSNSSISSLSSTSSGNSSDKENKTDERNPAVGQISGHVFAQSRDFPYYVYPREQQPDIQAPRDEQPECHRDEAASRQEASSGVNLLASVAVTNSGLEAHEERSFNADGCLDQSSNRAESGHVFLYPEAISPSYSTYSNSHNSEILLNVGNCSSLLNLPGNDARRRVEAALEAVEEDRQREYINSRVMADSSHEEDEDEDEDRQRQQILTPPSSNPVSPAPASPDPLDLAAPIRETLILPPRKRCKMILESMESQKIEFVTNSQRHSSVIQFARAS